MAAVYVGRLSKTTSCWRLVGRRHDRGGQRDDHERENLIGVRSTFISNGWDELGVGADDFWYSSMRMPPLPTHPTH